MFYSLTGTVVYFDQTCVALDCGGVAFRCTASLNTLQTAAKQGERVTLYTHLSVREDALELFGFATPEELEFFKMLIDVNGVGPKAAISILSQHTPSSLALSIAAGDSKAISRAQGVGPKIAQRVILELKDKVARTMPDRVAAGQTAAPQAGFGGNVSEAVSALTALGFSGSEAAKALANADPADSVENLIKQGLKLLSKGI